MKGRARLGKWIAQRRKFLGFKQDDLAKRLGVTKSAISRVESGLTRPGVGDAARWARALRLDRYEMIEAILRADVEDAGLRCVVSVEAKVVRNGVQ